VLLINNSKNNTEIKFFLQFPSSATKIFSWNWKFCTKYAKRCAASWRRNWTMWRHLTFLFLITMLKSFLTAWIAIRS